MINLKRLWYKILGYKLFEVTPNMKVDLEIGTSYKENQNMLLYLCKIIKSRNHRCEMWIKKVKSL